MTDLRSGEGGRGGGKTCKTRSTLIAPLTSKLFRVIAPDQLVPLLANGGAYDSRLLIAPRNMVLLGDALDRLRRLPNRLQVDTVMTSPPYFRLRDYAADGQLGLESHVDQWVERLVEISAEVHRVLVPTGTYWLNLGDTYSTHLSQGCRSQAACLMAPERLGVAAAAGRLDHPQQDRLGQTEPDANQHQRPA